MDAAIVAGGIFMSAVVTCVISVTSSAMLLGVSIIAAAVAGLIVGTAWACLVSCLIVALAIIIPLVLALLRCRWIVVVYKVCLNRCADFVLFGIVNCHSYYDLIERGLCFFGFSLQRSCGISHQIYDVPEICPDETIR